MDNWECRRDTLSTIVYAYEAMNRNTEAIEIRKQLLEECKTFKLGHSYFYITEIAEAYEKPGDANNAITYYEMLDEDERDQTYLIFHEYNSHEPEHA